MTKHQEVKTFRGGTEIRIYNTEIPNFKGEVALSLTKHLCNVPMEPDGEDSTGRQKFKTLSPPQVAERACEIAEALYLEFRARGWVVELPEPKLPKDE